MSMRLLAADLSLGRPFTSTPTSLLADNCLRRPRELMNMSNGDCLLRDDHQQLSMSSCNDQPPSDLHALEVYHKALEDERLKIQAFERELPFCMQLLDDAIEASKEQLEERLTCKLNTPLHDSPAHHQFVCNYTSSLMRGSATLTPTVGEINLHFKRSWSCTSPGPSSATPIDMAPSFDPTTRSLQQKTTMSTSIKDSPRSTLVEGCIKLQDVSLGHSTVPAAVDQNIHKTSLMFSSSTKSMDKIHPSHQLHTTSAMHLSSKPCRANGEQKGSDNMEAGCMQLDYKVDDIIKDHDDKRRCIQANPATLSINAPARLISANLSSPNSMYPRSISITKLAREEIHINTSLTSNSLAKATPLSSTSNTNTLQPGGVQRKPRRCWSPELHQRFLSALNHLGGCQVATPKQIRELMNVEGLTNDEVKSHLQKFRLHMRRPNAVNANSVQSTPPQTTGHHLVVFGHIWVPPEYANGEEHHHGAGAAASCRSIMQNIPKSFPDTEFRSEEMEHERSNVVKSLMSHDTLFRSTHNYACSFYSHDDQEASISRRNNNDIDQLADRQSPPHEAVHHSHNHPELEQLKSATSHAILHVATKGSDQQADTETAENGDAFADHETDISNMPRPARTQHAHCYPARFGSNLDDHGNLAQRMQVNVRAELSTSRDDVNLDGADKAGAGAKLGMEDGNDKPLLHLLKARDDNTSELLNGNSSKVSEHEALQLQADDERANINLTVGHHVNADPEYALHAADLGISADGAGCTYQL